MYPKLIKYFTLLGALISCHAISAATEPRTPVKWSASTNLLYDALAVPNLGAEIAIGRKWSIAGNWMYGWWDNNRRHRYWRAYGGQLEARYWLGDRNKIQPLRGHHLGAYAQVLTYDFEWGGKGYMAGKPGGNIFDRASYAFGIEYGYSLPIRRRLNLDFTIGLGYMGGKYIEYIPKDGQYVWQSTKQRHWWGPTNVSVTLVWLLGRDNRNNDKR